MGALQGDQEHQRVGHARKLPGFRRVFFIYRLDGRLRGRLVRMSMQRKVKSRLEIFSLGPERSAVGGFRWCALSKTHECQGRSVLDSGCCFWSCMKVSTFLALFRCTGSENRCEPLPIIRTPVIRLFAASPGLYFTSRPAQRSVARRQLLAGGGARSLFGSFRQLPGESQRREI